MHIKICMCIQINGQFLGVTYGLIFPLIVQDFFCQQSLNTWLSVPAITISLFKSGTRWIWMKSKLERGEMLEGKSINGMERGRRYSSSWLCICLGHIREDFRSCQYYVNKSFKNTHCLEWGCFWSFLPPIILLTIISNLKKTPWNLSQRSKEGRNTLSEWMERTFERELLQDPDDDQNTTSFVMYDCIHHRRLSVGLPILF